MGNAHLQDSRGISRDPLEKALAAHRACLFLDDAALQNDARHNLELARLLWLKAIPEPRDPPRSDDPNSKSKNTNSKNSGNKKDDVKNGKDTDQAGNHDAAEPGKGGPRAKSAASWLP